MAKPKVFVARKLPGSAVEELRKVADVDQWPEILPPPRAELIARLKECDGALTLLTDRIDAELLNQAPKLKVVSNMAVGYDNIDVSACAARGVKVGNTPGVLTETCADFTFALLLAAARRLVEGAAFAKSGEWKTWDPNLLLGRDVYGATLGIAGMGKIGQAVARRAAGFGMRILYESTTTRPFGERVDKRTLFRESDFVSVHLPLNARTRHYVNAESLGWMKPTAILINTSRGGTVDQAALLSALASGRPAFAALDVTDPEPPSSDDPILHSPHVLVVPHIASASQQTRERMARMAVDNLRAGLEGRPLPNEVHHRP